ncbi:translation initiation factor IF-2-like isoform X3 [Phyllostomus discolor]|uniref:Translation initiation factor IF-2-like isoform X3 n=1 Tax=Phyllostomus discolor TaxID=89673 RepID=A0A7E6CL97_9CHIR|nr:translation initiation factor IF-2-like isoform X3 [Phyllostomus discolor]XP_035867676.1 translation initiation factor IF-2-like isoform X3 [Phyllostomus discolor]XP_035867677.1 translation initiation factor IF-2-like isoform X3 [Phyllostomus discolor]XP_035867678.1 translation initiation factor IF-2-like isoform X3 [Phyllostomus discolor]
MLLGHRGWPTCCLPPRAAPGKRRRPSRPPPAPGTRPPAPGAAARALGPPKGRRTRRRPRRTYRAGSPAPPARHPAAAAVSTEQRAHTALGQIQRSRAQRRGPRRGSGVGLGEGGAVRGGEGREQQVLQLPSVPTARQRRARDAGGEGSARSANEFTFFFSPALSPSPFPPAPPASSLAAGGRGPARVFGSRPGSGRTETAREELEGKVGRRAGRAAREQHPGPCVCVAGDAPAECARAGRVHVSVCVSVGARRAEEPTMRFPLRVDRGRAQSQGELDRLRPFIILASSAPQLVKMTGVIRE